MEFKKLTIETLKLLKSRGFNILTSNNQLTDTKVIWFPEKVDDINDYLMEVAGEEPTFIVIDDALSNVEEVYLYAEVFM